VRIIWLALAVVLCAACGVNEPMSGPSTDASAMVVPSRSPAATSSSAGPSPSEPITGGTDEGAEPVPEVLVPDQSGTYALANGTSVAVRLDRGPAWEEPIVEGDAVEVTRTAFESDPGYDQYEVRARTSGTATVTFRAPAATARFSFVVE